MRRCLNPDCRKPFSAAKPWKRYCSSRCGNILRMRTYRALRKNPGSVFTISPLFTSEKLRSNALKHKIDVFEDRIIGWIFNPINELLKIYNCDFAAVALALCYFEGIEMWEVGKESKSKSREFFKAAFKKVFGPPALNSTARSKFPNKDYEDEVAEKIYGLARCGFFHAGMAREGIAILRLKSDYTFRYGIAEDGEIGTIVIYPRSFFTAVERHFRGFMRRLRDPRNKELRGNFLTMWNITHSGKPMMIPDHFARLDVAPPVAPPTTPQPASST